MKKIYVKILLAGFLGLLGIQYSLSMKGIEPYPTAMYPEFSYLLPESESIQIVKPDFVATFADGETLKVNYYELLGVVPISHVNHLVVNNLNPKRRVTPERYQDKPYRQFNLGRYSLEFRRRPLMPSEEELRQRAAFFKDRLTAVTGRQNPVKLDITWYEYDFYFGKGLDLQNRRPVYDNHFNLEDPVPL